MEITFGSGLKEEVFKTFLNFKNNYALQLLLQFV